MLELGSLNRAISLDVERTVFSAGLYFWRMRTSFLVVCLVRVLNRRVAVAKDASPWQKQALNKLDASSMEALYKFDVASRKLRALESRRGPGL